MLYFGRTFAVLFILAAILHIRSSQELQGDTSQSVLHSLDKTLEAGKRVNSSIMKSAPSSSLVNYDDDDDYDDNDDDDEDDEEGSGQGDGEEGSTLSAPAHKKETINATFSKVKSGEDLETNEGEVEDSNNKSSTESTGEDDHEDSSYSSTVHGSTASPNSTHYSQNIDETEQDNEFPDEEADDDEEEDVEDDEPVGRFPSSNGAAARYIDQEDDVTNFQEDEDEPYDNEAGSTREFSEFGRGSNATLISKLVFSGDEKAPLSYAAERRSERHNRTKEQSTSTATSRPHKVDAGKLATKNSSTEGIHNATGKLQTHTIIHTEKSETNGTGNATLHGNSKKQVPSYTEAEGRHNVQRVSGKRRGKAVITVFSHSSKKQMKGRFQVPREKFLGRGVSLMASSLKQPIKNASTSARHSLVRQQCHSNDILEGHSLKGGTKAGHVVKLGETAGIQACIKRCCHAPACDVALRVDGKCYGVACYSKELCKSIPVPHPHFIETQLAFINKADKRGGFGGDEIHCKYGNITLRNNERWSGELCGGVVVCKDGIATMKKCTGIPPKPQNCYSPRLTVKHRKGKCCKLKWSCKGKHCVFGGRVVKHGYSLSDPLCTGVVQCFNGRLEIKFCPKIPDKPKDCAHPKLKIVTRPGQCCKKHWVCSDKSCKYDNLKLAHGEKATDASCAVVVKCKNGFLSSKPCPGPPLIPTGCINPSLDIMRTAGRCCEMNWKCAMT